MTLPRRAAWHLRHPVGGDKPWDVQTEALACAGDRRGFGYWLEQGLGKTPLILNEVYDKWRRGLIDGAVVICPNSIKYDWAVAVSEWGIPPEHMTGHYWPAYEFPDQLRDQILAINYEAASRPGKVSEYLLWLMEQSRIFLALDETSSIANPNSQTTKAIIELAKRAEFVRGLNGTPLTKNVMDYWAQLRSLGELDGTNPYAFRARYAQMGGFMGKEIRGIRNEEELAALLEQCTFRALKKDWRKGLPPKVHQTLHLEMTARQLRHYNEMMEDFYTQIASIEVAAAMVLNQMDKLRQISSCLILDQGNHEWLEPPKSNPKLRACIDWVTANPGKAMVTAVFRPSVELLFQTFHNLKLDPVVIRGGMSEKAWAEAKERFNTDPRCRVLVGQQSAVFRGHTLIGTPDDPCSRMFFYESNFSYYERAQLEDRIHRGAQQQTCYYVDTVASPMEKRMLDMIQGKRQQADGMDALVALIRDRNW